MLTAVAAVGLVWCEPRPAEAMRIAANALGTDTDTIATMAGAILGATAEADPPIDVLDAAVFRSEARRLVRIASGEDPPSHEYPDLLHWSAPKTRADALARSKDGGLGREAHRRRSSGGKGVEARRVQGDHRGGCGIQRDADRYAEPSLSLYCEPPGGLLRDRIVLAPRRSERRTPYEFLRYSQYPPVQPQSCSPGVCGGVEVMGHGAEPEVGESTRAGDPGPVPRGRRLPKRETAPSSSTGSTRTFQWISDRSSASNASRWTGSSSSTTIAST